MLGPKDLACGSKSRTKVMMACAAMQSVLCTIRACSDMGRNSSVGLILLQYDDRLAHLWRDSWRRDWLWPGLRYEQGFLHEKRLFSG